MANLDSLLLKIKEDGDKQVQEILDDAKNQETSMIEKKRKEAQDEGERIILRSKDQAALLSERIISNTNLKIRDEKLTAKQELMNKTFNKALENLEAMNKDDFYEYLQKSILNADLDGDEKILLNEKRMEQVNKSQLNALNTSLKEKGKVGKMHTEAANISDGFILVKTGVEINYTFEKMIDAYREELEFEISKKLFQA